MGAIGKDNLIICSIVLSLVLAAILFVYAPQGRKMRALETELATQKQTLESDAAKAAVVPDMMRQVQEMKNRYKNFDRRLPKQKELDGFLREITGNLAQEKLVNQLMQIGDPSKTEHFNTLPIAMKFQGSYLALGSFLKRLDSMERLTRIQKLTIQTDPKTGVNIDMQMNIYFTQS